MPAFESKVQSVIFPVLTLDIYLQVCRYYPELDESATQEFNVAD